MSEIMKRLLILVAALAVLLPGRASAQSSMPFEMSAGLSLGVMDGIGVELGFGVTEKLNVRAGYSIFPNMLIKDYSISLPKWGSNPATETAFTGRGSGSGNLLVDFHPTAGSFRVTAGLFFGSQDFIKVYNTIPLPESYHAAGVNYFVDADKSDLTKWYRIQSDDKGVMSAALKAGAVKPFIGIGFGSAVPKGRVGASFDLGLEYSGGLSLTAPARNISGEVETIDLTTVGLKQTVKDIRTNKDDTSYDKYLDYVDKLRALPVLPVARISVFVKLF